MADSNERNQPAEPTGLEIAVIGMAGSFPGASNIDELWENLKNGVESILFFNDKELEAAGVSPESFVNPGYVKTKGGILTGQEEFDAVLFGYTPLEAEIMDPQSRKFHECVWTALEHAGCNWETYDGLIGLYAGASADFYWEALTLMSRKQNEVGGFASIGLIGREFLSTMVSYKLNLQGPAFTVLTACSTSLAAIHLACQGLLNGECGIALAGGVSIDTSASAGYLYREGMIRAPDGHCRTFDAKAGGTIGGNGLGVVVLKLLEDAAADNDFIHAVIKGTAINNDGHRKGSYSAPSIEGQAEVIRTALQAADVKPENIGYIEAHGTGTPLGDPIEIEALKMAFATEKKAYCAIGSVKTNIGHLDAAAGVTGFIKTVLAIKHRLIPPSLHFETPNPKIDFANSPFYVNRELSPWKSNGLPLQAGVSSFGIGGTNAHVVLEEWPGTQSAERTAYGKAGKEKGAWNQGRGGVSPPGQSWEYHLILLSARTPSALEKMTENLTEYLKNNLLNPDNHENPTNPGPTLADTAYTLQVGRRELPYRRMLGCTNVKEAIEALTSPGLEKVNTYLAETKKPPTIFMFPGQGSQYENMGQHLYQTEPVFRHEMDRCFDILKSLMNCDIKEILYPHPGCRGGSTCPPTDCVGLPGQGDHRESPLQSDRINQTEITQPALFAIEYALARLLMKWGIQPYAMIGHSIGEYVAAHLSGVFSIEDALKLVTMRGKLMQQMPSGSMLSVPLAREKLQPLIDENENISIAVVNTPSSCVVSGSHETIEKFEKELKNNGYETRRLHTSHAFHSRMMEPIVKKFADKVRKVTLKKPGIPYISNVSGTWITIEEAADPGYWAKQLRRTVRFSDGIGELIKLKGAIFLEVGPGKALSAFLKQHPQKKSDQFVLNLVRHVHEDEADGKYLQEKLGHLWLYGQTIDWKAYYESQNRYRFPLPTYPFERKRYWIEGNLFKLGKERLANNPKLLKKSNISDWFYIPQWQRSIPALEPGNSAGGKVWLVFTGESPLMAALIQQLRKDKQNVITVLEGPGYKKSNLHEYIINPRQGSDYEILFKDLVESGNIPHHIVHLWSLTDDDVHNKINLEELDKLQDLGLYHLIHTARAIGNNLATTNLQLNVITNNIQDVTGEEKLCPGKATILGPVKIIPLEYYNISCRCIDIMHPGEDIQKIEVIISNLLRELSTDFTGTEIVAYRGAYRWAQTFEPVKLTNNAPKVKRLKKQGVYLLTGGCGGMGFTIAESLARTLKARLILIDIQDFPLREKWADWLDNHSNQDETSKKIRKILELEKNGAKIHVHKADVSNFDQVKEVISKSEKQFGEINGVIHTAGLIDYGGIIQRRTRQVTEELLAAKVKGTMNLDRIFNNRPLDFMVLFSSIGNILYGIKFGQVGYNAGHEFLDVYSHYKQQQGTFAVTIEWNDWNETGMAAKATNKTGGDKKGTTAFHDFFTISPPEGLLVFYRILENHFPQVAVSNSDLKGLLDYINSSKEETSGLSRLSGNAKYPETFSERPELRTQYAAPVNETEKTLVNIWQRFFGIKKIGTRDNFFDLGGDSLKAAAVTSKIHKAFNISLPLAELFNTPTIKGLAAYIKNAESNRFLTLEPTEEKEYYPLSSAQKRLYIIQQMEKESTMYNMVRTYPLAEGFDSGQLKDTLEKLVARHESFRTAFFMKDSQPVQAIHKQVNLEIENIDQGKKTPAEIMKDFLRPFDLSKPPLLRPGLLKTVDNKHLLLLDIHHIITDAASDGIWYKEFKALFSGETLSPQKLQYKDYTWWFNRRQTRENMTKQQEYWLKRFSGDPPMLNIPTDYQRIPGQSLEGQRITFEIKPQYLEKLRIIEKKQGMTMFMILLALYNILLLKLSGQEDIVIGTVTAGRQHADLENIIGMFVNTLAMRNFPRRSRTFKEFSQEVKKTTLEAFSNQDYPFEELVEKIVKKREPGRSPLFDAALFFLASKENTSEVNLEQINAGREWFKTGIKFDLVLTLWEKSKNLFACFDYRVKLFKQETIEKFCGYFQEIIAAVSENHDILLENIAISCDLAISTSDYVQEDDVGFDF